MNKIFVVVTGDVRNSSVEFKNQQKLLLRRLNKIYNFVKKYFPEALPYNIDIFRGDSFQFFISDYEKAVDVAIGFILYAKYLKIDLKIGLGIGKVDYLKKSKISESNGEVFILSGKAFENLRKNSNIGLELSDNIDVQLIKAYLDLLDIYIEGLSDKNAMAVFGKLVNLTQQEIALIWEQDISQQSISKHWKNVKVDKFLESLNRFSLTLIQIIKKAIL